MQKIRFPCFSIQVWIWQFLAKKFWQNIFWQNFFGTKEKIGILFCQKLKIGILFYQKLKIGTTSKLAKTRKLHLWATCFDLLTFWTPSAHTKYKHYSWLRGVLMGIWLKATRKSVTNISIRLFFYYIDFGLFQKVFENLKLNNLAKEERR